MYQKGPRLPLKGEELVEPCLDETTDLQFVNLVEVVEKVIPDEFLYPSLLTEHVDVAAEKLEVRPLELIR